MDNNNRLKMIRERKLKKKILMNNKVLVRMPLANLMRMKLKVRETIAKKLVIMMVKIMIRMNLERIG